MLADPTFTEKIQEFILGVLQDKIQAYRRELNIGVSATLPFMSDTEPMKEGDVFFSSLYDPNFRSYFKR